MGLRPENKSNILDYKSPLMKTGLIAYVMHETTLQKAIKTPKIKVL
ncbi:hypothetical protein [Lacinutrix sp. Hel_I_90]|nr:hypothetical protein [Lacinutrix sp. Hel_I_90]